LRVVVDAGIVATEASTGHASVAAMTLSISS